MKLLLHIGTHKTASTSLQHFCMLNRSLLETQGFLYPGNRDGVYAANFLASQLAYGRQAEVKAYMQAARDQAEKAGCHTVVISAESFYAMSAFFFNIHGRPCGDYWENESNLIRQLKECCIGFDTQIICYLRAQDEYAGSLYNQLVKNSIGIAGTYEDFVESARQIFDYDSHLKLWENQFGREKIVLKNFRTHIQDIEKDFCISFLNEACYTGAQKKNIHANERLSRDVLEAKRNYNKTKPDRALGFISARTFRHLANMEEDAPGYQIFAPLAFRTHFFESFSEGNKDLADRYGIGALPVMTDRGETTYPGLAPDKEQEIMEKFNAIMNHPALKAELFLRRLVQKSVTKSPLMDMLLMPARRLQRILRLRLFGW